ncbi:MAG TPA: VCBS repeat-containing protein, partial [Gemmataceae bacterium]|nr:VCBS repeat-containing protein [Gemmataceae bacterium]
LLMGQDVDLFRFATPIFNLGFSYTQEFPILPPLVATVTGRVGASFFLTFGYDTFGVREAFASHNVLDVFDGFFVDTAGSAVLVSASLAVGAALNFVIASGGVEGGLFANVALRLHDPNGDGKLRWKEARDVLATDPLRLFEIRGTVIARLYAWLQIAGMPRTVLDLVPPIDVLALPGALPGTAPTFPPPAPGPAPVPDSPMRLSASVGVVTLAHGFTPPANNPPPAGVEFPAGFVTFQVGGLEPGGSTVVTLSLPWLNALDNGRITTYYKFGRTRDNPTPHWYSFMFDGTTGAKIRTQVRQRVTEGNLETEFLSTVTLYLIDGERGDDDLTANGVIVDPGAPAVAPVPAPAATSPVVIPPAPSTVGVFAPGTATWYLRDSNTPGAPDITPFAYGASGWQPVVGDWNGDGTTTIGVFDPTTATWYLKNSNTPGAPDYKPFAYGMPGWIPVVGDWDGDGITTIGVVDPTTMTWYLRNSNSPGAPDYKPFAYGASGWIPVVGDWDGDGSTTIGVVDPATMTWYLKNSNSPGAPDIAPFAYGGVGDIPTVGDWQGTGTTSIGVFNTISGDWKLRNSNSPGAPDITRFAYGAPGWTPVPGRFSADVQLLLAAGGAGAGAAPISQTAVDVTVAVALDRLQQAGVNPAVLDRLKGVTAVLQELPPGQLGVVLPQDRQMVLSPDGAGYGWFVDPTPGQDEEFADGLALPAGAADGREDLLTAVLHELAGLAGLAEDGNLLAAGQRNTQALDRIFAAAQQ